MDVSRFKTCVLCATLSLIDRAANRLGVGGIILYAQKA